jgi:hypothetical protein
MPGAQKRPSLRTRFISRGAGGRASRQLNTRLAISENPIAPRQSTTQLTLQLCVPIHDADAQKYMSSTNLAVEGSSAESERLLVHHRIFLAHVCECLKCETCVRMLVLCVWKLCMYVCVYVCMCVCVYACACVCMCVYVCMCVCVYLCMFARSLSN